MSNLVNHGASCCGVRHIYGMDNTTVAQLEGQIASVDAIPVNGGSATSGRLIEIILSSRQVGEPNPRGGTGNRWAPCVQAEGGWPAVMQRLGFRLVSRFENKNSGADCYIFHRVPRFKSIRPADLPFAWDHGSYQRPGAAALDEGGQGARVVAPVEREEWRIGDRIRYGGTNGLAGLMATVTNVRDERTYGGNRYDLRFDNGERRERYTSMYFTRVNAPAPPVVVAMFYANVLQAGMGAFWPTLEAARAAAPRCRQQARIEVLSDGTRRTVNL